MGCSTSRLDDEEAVQLCKDRKQFIKQAVEQRTRFASGHLAYIQSLKRVSAALRDYVEGDEPREFLIDSFITPPFTPVKKSSSGYVSISPSSFPPAQIKSKPNSTMKVNYLRSGGNPAVSVEERPQSPETVRVESYSPMPQYEYGADGFFAMQSSPMNNVSSSFYSYSPNRSNIPPQSPQTSQWDFFWNPFSSLDNYGYPTRYSLDQPILDDDIRGLRQVREEEGIPDLEEDVAEQEQPESKEQHVKEERGKTNANCSREEVVVEDVDEDDEDDDEEEEDDEDDDEEEVTDCCGTDTEHDANGLQSQGRRANMEMSRAQTSRQVEVGKKEMAIGKQEDKGEPPGFTVYVNRRPTSMAEVIKDLEDQFMVVCNAANEVSALLEASKAQYSSNDLSGFTASYSLVA